jgi:hypothetical protein
MHEDVALIHWHHYIRNSILVLVAAISMAHSTHLIPPSHPFIRYGGRWDTSSDSTHAFYSWPGVYLCATFTGTSVGVRLNDHTNFFNVYIDGTLHNVFHGTKDGDADYLLVSGLKDTIHSLRLTRRNITFEKPYAFGGILVDSGASLLPPLPPFSRRMEFIGDSFTAAESNEAVEQELPWEARYPVTNIDKGFAPLIAQHFQAEYITTCRSGSGLVCDWRGDQAETIPARFDHTLMESDQPRWDFTRWKPDVAVICLGLNDHSGLRGKGMSISQEHADQFCMAYHEFVDRLRWLYPGVKIVAVAAFPEWIRTNVSRVVSEEKATGHTDVFYATFDEFPGGYVANGHPTVATHQKMAEQLIRAMEKFQLFN